MSKHANTRARSSAASSKSSRRRRAAKWARVALAAAPVLGAGAVAAPAIAQNQSGQAKYSFETLNNQNDVTFNQLLGINDHGTIAGYFGSGAAGGTRTRATCSARPTGRAAITTRTSPAPCRPRSPG